MYVFEFAEFQVNPQEGVLYRNSQPVQLTPKVFDTLLALVSRSGQLVSKEILMKEIWGDCFVEENNLTQHIFTLRRILGEDREGRKFIETVPRKGYRFTAEVRWRKIQKTEPAITLIQEIHNTDPVIHETPVDQADESSRPVQPVFFQHFYAYGLIILLVLVSLGFAVRLTFREKAFASNPGELKFKQLTEKGNLRGAAISPDGNSLVYAVLENQRYSLRLRNLPTDSEIVIYTAPENVSVAGPQFSPDGNLVYFGQAATGEQGEIYRVPVLGGTAAFVAKNPWSGFSVSPDGSEIAFPRFVPAENKHLIIIAKSDGSGERAAAEVPGPRYFALWGPAPAWSPDGKRLTAISGEVGRPASRLVEIDPDDKSMREFEYEGDWDYVQAIRWANENELIMAAKGKNDEKTQLWRVNFPDGRVRRLSNDFTSYLSFNLNRDLTRMVALRQIENTHLWYFDRRTGNTRRLTSGENRSDGVSGLTFAPDGEIVFTARNKNEQNIFSMALDGGPVRQLTRNLGPRNVTPDISPDNQKIVFVSKQTGASRIWIMNRDGSEPKQLTPPSDDHSIEQNAPKFTPDGKWVYFWTFQIGRVAICKISAAGGEPLLVSKAREFVASPAISPDGRWMSFFSHDDQAKPPWRVGIRSLTGDEERYFTIPAGRQLTGWMPDSQTIVSINFQDGNLWQTNVETGTRDRITNFQDERIDNFDVSEDGRYFLLARGNAYWDAVLIEK